MRLVVKYQDLLYETHRAAFHSTDNRRWLLSPYVQVLNEHGILAELDGGLSADPKAQVQPFLADGVPKHMHSAVERLANLSKRVGSESTSVLWTEIAR